ncbi:MAG: transporter substrate-binding domain-containing protein [Candidatus Mcinerneyibacterium aminivorans]|uniref:Transporter substrate-binding domain-containing protein n=1 Tax=Candidatus Mcinerneyibacterium aminivorans TaxID=2703815 RepID=A0A5D0MDW6_9BACT|nr:MAG: transporter substrate-binding domain-containing protein [Candidatus Mcinerneyibacterium aminivorans]
MNKSLLKLGIIILSVFLVFSLFSCGKNEKEVLRVGTNAEYPPFEFTENNEFKGIDMDLAKVLGEKLNMEVKIHDMDFDSLIPALNAKKIDIAMAAMTVTEDRKEQVDFSIPYYSVDQAIIAPEDSNIEINEEDDLTEYTIGAQNGTTGQIYIDKNFIDKDKMNKKQLNKYPTNIEAITDMLNGNLDLVIIDSSAAKGYKKMKPIKTIYTIKTGENYAIALRQDSQLKEKINTALKEILKSDQWTDILNRYIK